ncbi:protein of unknown function [Shinella sp. WSC3-e]|nr:hypothetical protein SHINE37_41135 [Rhizobiaceae bacterium]CAK7255776.1 protein of unknown function [Shinella sp. WSC3-e]
MTAGIEQGTVLLDRLAHAADLVSGQVVHDHDVAGAKLRCETLLCVDTAVSDQPLGVEIERAVEPSYAAPQNIGALPLGGVCRLCLNVMPHPGPGTARQSWAVRRSPILKSHLQSPQLPTHEDRRSGSSPSPPPENQQEQ